MCLNCGCGVPRDDMGNKDNVTLETLAKAAIASDMSAQDTIEEMKKALDRLDPAELENAIEHLKSAK